MYTYGIHFELRLFDSIWKVGPSGIRTHDLVLTVHTLLTTEVSGRTIRCAELSTGSSDHEAQVIAR